MSSSVPRSEPVSKARSAMNLRGIVFIALFAALFIAASFMKINLAAGVPFSLQAIAVMLAGGLLGAVYGFWSIFIVVALTALGLPLMNGSGGWAQITGPTGGFIWMFPVSAFVIGYLTDKIFAKPFRSKGVRITLLLVTMFAFGSLLLYVTGVPWFAHYSPTLELKESFEKVMLPFLPGDAIKAVVASLIVLALKPVIPAIRPYAEAGNKQS